MDADFIESLENKCASATTGPRTADINNTGFTPSSDYHDVIPTSVVFTIQLRSLQIHNQSTLVTQACSVLLPVYCTIPRPRTISQRNRSGAPPAQRCAAADPNKSKQQKLGREGRAERHDTSTEMQYASRRFKR